MNLLKKYLYLIKIDRDIMKTLKNRRTITKCHQKYALCPAAKCVPNPLDDKKALCDCFVETGTNYSVRGRSRKSTCKSIKRYKKKGVEYIYSTFSPIIKKKGYSRIFCPSKGINLDCMNKLCSVDPQNPKRAICVCSKTNNRGKKWATFNKKNTSSSCIYLSGASKIDSQKMDQFIKKKE
jgi:hypothetical protein